MYPRIQSLDNPMPDILRVINAAEFSGFTY